MSLRCRGQSQGAYREIHRLMEVAVGYRGFPGHEEQPQSLAIFHPACRALRRCQRMGKDLSGLGHVCLRYRHKSRFVSSALSAVAAPPIFTAVESPMRDTTFARLLRK